MAAPMLMVALCVVVLAASSPAAPQLAAAKLTPYYLARDYIRINCSRSRSVPNIDCDLLLAKACHASADDLDTPAAACALRAQSNLDQRITEAPCSDELMMNTDLQKQMLDAVPNAFSSACSRFNDPNAPPPPIVLACALRQETGSDGAGTIMEAIHRTPEARLAGSCELKERAVHLGGFSALTLKNNISPRECLALEEDCSRLASAGVLSTPTPGELSSAVTVDVVVAAIQGLRNGSIPVQGGQTSVALGVACAMGKSPYLLNEACDSSRPPSRCIYEDLCLDAFMKGTTLISSAEDVTDTILDRLTKKIRHPTTRVVTYKDCCKELLHDACFCRIKEKLIKAGKDTIGCLKQMACE